MSGYYPCIVLITIAGLLSNKTEAQEIHSEADYLDGLDAEAQEIHSEADYLDGLDVDFDQDFGGADDGFACEDGDSECHQATVPAYLIYRPNMGRFGNQIDHLLGAIGLARTLKRVLVVPPLVKYEGSNGLKLIPLSEVFSMTELNRSGTHIIPMEDLAATLPEMPSTIYCVEKCRSDVRSPDSHAHIFWSQLGFSFEEEYIIPLDDRFDGSAASILATLSPLKHPFMVLEDAPFAYPVEPHHRQTHQYLKWAKDSKIDPVPFKSAVAVHLRGATDWVSACRRMTLGNPLELMSSPQCGMDRSANKIISSGFCAPDVSTMAQTVLSVLSAEDLSSVFIGTDCKICSAKLKEEIILRSSRKVKFLDFEGSVLSDLQHFAMAKAFIGNCVSSFSAFAARARALENLGTYWWPHNSTDMPFILSSADDIIPKTSTYVDTNSNFWEEVQHAENEKSTAESENFCRSYYEGNLYFGFGGHGNIQCSESFEGLDLNGTFVIDNYFQQRLGLLEKLIAVGGDLRVQNSMMSDLNFKLLQQIDGDLIIRDMPGLSVLAFPSLAQIHGRFHIQSTSLLTLHEYPSLSFIQGDVMIIDNEQLESVEISALVDVMGAFNIINNERITRITVPKLSVVGGWFEIYRSHRLSILGLGLLQLVHGVFAIAHAGVLNEISLHRDFAVKSLHDGHPTFPYSLDFTNMKHGKGQICSLDFYINWLGPKRCTA